MPRHEHSSEPINQLPYFPLIILYRLYHTDKCTVEYLLPLNVISHQSVRSQSQYRNLHFINIQMGEKITGIRKSGSIW